MSNEAVAGGTGVEALLAEARSKLDRVGPRQAFTEAERGAALVDIRSEVQVIRDGRIPGAWIVPRNVLEWRVDPDSPHRIDELAVAGRRLIVVCHEGFQSSLAAAALRGFGIDATDLIGGFRAWRATGLPVL